MTLRAALFWVITKRVVAVPYRLFGDNLSVLPSGFKNPKQYFGALSFSLVFLNPEDGIYRLYRNVGKKLPLLVA